MKYPIGPLWWPLLVATAPINVPYLLWRAQVFRSGKQRASSANASRLAAMRELSLPVLERLAVTPLVEWRCRPGFIRDPGVSYFLRGERGALLMDLGFGLERPAIRHNIAAAGCDLSEPLALALSHLHPDHMGGVAAWRRGAVALDGLLAGRPCYAPAPVRIDGDAASTVTEPSMLAAGFASTGPLARMLFFEGWTEEQALIARLAGRGLVVMVGCGHPGLDVILRAVRRITREPIYAMVGGVHLPLTGSREPRAGLEVQCLLGTGKPPWRRLDDEDLTRAIALLNEVGLKRLLVSGHDSCDHSLGRLAREVKAEVEVLEAGATYDL